MAGFRSLKMPHSDVTEDEVRDEHGRREAADGTHTISVPRSRRLRVRAAVRSPPTQSAAA